MFAPCAANGLRINHSSSHHLWEHLQCASLQGTIVSSQLTSNNLPGRITCAIILVEIAVLIIFVMKTDRMKLSMLSMLSYALQVRLY